MIQTEAKAIVRKAAEADAAACLVFAKAMFEASDQLLRVPGELQLTVEQEADWIRNAAEKNNLILVAIDGDAVVGLLDCHVKPFVKQSHVAEFGVSVLPNRQGVGTGTALLNAMMKWVEKETAIEKLVLNVFDTNPRAIKLYQRFGFAEESRQRKAAKQSDGTYVDMIQMCRFVR